MNIQWKYSSPVEESTIIAVAHSHNVTLPNLLVKMIMEGNNGTPSKRKFFYDNDNNEDIFKTMLSYNPNDIENVYSALAELHGNPSLYPFGNDPGGNLICVKDSKVVLWKHENNIISPVSDSIDSFFEELH